MHFLLSALQWFKIHAMALSQQCGEQSVMKATTSNISSPAKPAGSHYFHYEAISESSVWQHHSDKQNKNP